MYVYMCMYVNGGRGKLYQGGKGSIYTYVPIKKKKEEQASVEGEEKHMYITLFRERKYTCRLNI